MRKTSKEGRARHKTDRWADESGFMAWTKWAARIGKTFPKKQDTLILIPMYKEFDLIKSHLERLKAQTTHAFDVLLVLNAVTDEKKVGEVLGTGGYPFSVHVVKRYEDTGSAGGYFTGQCYAVEEGYAYLVMGDADCMPVDADLVAKLLERKTDAWACPKVKFLDMKTGQAASASETLHSIVFYNLLSTELVKKAGYYFLPAYTGGDDADFYQRVKRAQPQGPVEVDAYCMHPPDLYYAPVKYWAYSINFMVFNGRLGDIDFSRVAVSAGIGLNAAAALAAGQGWERRLAVEYIKALVLGRWGKSSWQKIQDSYSASSVSALAAAELEKQGIRFIDFELRRDAADSLFKRMKRDIGQVFHQKVAVGKCHGNYKAMPLAALASEAWFRQGDGSYILLAKNANPIIWALRLVLFGILALPLIVFMECVLVVSKLRRPDTGGFGKDLNGKR